MTSSRFSQSSIGQKIIMAVTGILLVLFVLIHMLGNLQLYANDGGKPLMRMPRCFMISPAVTEFGSLEEGSCFS